MKRKYEVNFNGYLVVLRAIQFLLKNHTLNFTRLGAYICFVAQADFDRRHKHYGVIIRDDYELAKEWGCSPSTVNRQRRELINKGLLIEENGLTKITNFLLFELNFVMQCARVPGTDLQSLFSKTIDEVAKILGSVAQMRSEQLQNDTQSSNISSKVELGLSNYDVEGIDSIMNSTNNKDR